MRDEHPESSIASGRVARIRFGVMCDGPVFAAWQARVIELLVSHPDIELALLVVNPAVEPGRRDLREALARKFELLPKLAWAAHHKLRVEPYLKSTRPVDLSALVASAPSIHCQATRTGRFNERFAAADVERIRAHGLDFILRFSYGILKGDILDAARFGVWSFHHGDEQQYRGTPPGFWEIYNGEKAIGVILQRLTSRLDAGILLYKGWFRCEPFSTLGTYRANLDTILAGAAHFPLVVCKRALSGQPPDAASSPVTTKAPICHAPTNREMSHYLVRQARRSLQAIAQRCSVEEWSIGIADLPIQEVLSRGLTSARWLKNERCAQEFHADPFGFVDPEDKRTVLLFESYEHARRRGRISQLVLSGEAGSVEQSLDVLSVDGHMSYPYILEHDGEIYCIPETCAQGSVSLFRYAKATKQWTKEQTLIDGFPAVDSSIIFFEGRWWLFCTNKDWGDNTHLFVWHAPELRGPWQQHDLCPVKTDVRNCRPAGSLFVFQDELYRPAQDCASGYGSAVVINKVVALSPCAFREEPVIELRPFHPDYRDGLHTISAVGDRILVDGFRYRFSPQQVLRWITRKR